MLERVDPSNNSTVALFSGPLISPLTSRWRPFPFPPSFFFFFLEFLYPPFSLPFRSGFPPHWSRHVFCWRSPKEGPGCRILARISFANVYLCVTLLFSLPIYPFFSPIFPLFVSPLKKESVVLNCLCVGISCPGILLVSDFDNGSSSSNFHLWTFFQTRSIFGFLYPLKVQGDSLGQHAVSCLAWFSAKCESGEYQTQQTQGTYTRPWTSVQP